MAESLETRFHEQMVNVYRHALTQAHYKATKFLEMVTMQGGLATAKALLHTPHLPDGFVNRGGEVKSHDGVHAGTGTLEQSVHRRGTSGCKRAAGGAQATPTLSGRRNAAVSDFNGRANHIVKRVLGLDLRSRFMRGTQSCPVLCAVAKQR